MASNPQSVQIAATYYPDQKQLSFAPGPPFTSDQAVTDFVFTLALATGVGGTVSWADPAVVFESPAPSPPWSVTVVGQVLTIVDTNWNTFSPTPLRFPFKMKVVYNQSPQTVDPTILNAEIPPAPGDGHGRGHGERAARNV